MSERTAAGLLNRPGGSAPGSTSHSRAGSPVTLALVHALGWLAIGSAVGVLLAVLLLVPELGDWLAPVSYGRLMPVHLDAGLYGWVALPLVGLLFAGFAVGAGELGAGGVTSWTTPRWIDSGARLVVVAWSGSLFAAALGWLAGRGSGKLFLEWTGPPRVAFCAALVGLWLVLGGGLWMTWQARRRVDRSGEDTHNAGNAGYRAGFSWRLGLWLALAAVPLGWWLATDPRSYPPVDPTTGGPTGTSLLGSTLGIVGLGLLLPKLLSLEGRQALGAAGKPLRGRISETRLWQAWAVHVAAFLALEVWVRRGDWSHRDGIEIVALVSVLGWIKPLSAHLSAYHWTPLAACWLKATLGWGGLLALTGVATFLPGLLDHWKFTNALVAHAHLALAGLLTSLVALIAVSLAAREQSAELFFVGTWAFRCWHGGLAIQLLALFALGTFEGFDPGLIPRGAALGTWLYGVRLVGGLLMFAAALYWLTTSLGALRQADRVSVDGRVDCGQNELSWRPTRGALAVLDGRLGSSPDGAR